MLKWPGIMIRTLRSVFRSRCELVLENPVLRQQLAAFKHVHPRPRLTEADRTFWLLLSKIWSGWREALHIVQPETVVRWQRQAFRKLLALEEPRPRPPDDRPGHSRADPADVSVESAIGQAKLMRQAIANHRKVKRLLQLWEGYTRRLIQLTAPRR